MSGLQKGESFGREPVPQSRPEAPVRRQQVEETEAGVGLVLQDVSGPAEEL